MVEGRRQPAVHRERECDVGEAEIGTADEGARLLQLPLEDFHLGRPLCDGVGDALGIVIGRVLAQHRIDRIAPGRVELAQLPEQPLLHQPARLEVGRQQPGAMLARQIADDRIALPEHKTIIDDHRHLGIGVEREEFRHVRVANRLAPILPVVRHRHLVGRPNHLAHVDRGDSAQHLQLGHVHFSLTIPGRKCRVFAFCDSSLIPSLPSAR